jgi:hypothetical protein
MAHAERIQSTSEKDKPKFFAMTLYKARARIEQVSDASNASSASRYAAKRQAETSDPSSVSLLVCA